MIREETRNRLLFFGTVALAMALTAWWVFGAWIAQSTCCGLSPEWLVIGVSSMAGLNIAVLLSLLVLRTSRGLLALAALQAANAVFGLAASLTSTPAWLLYYAAPALIIQALVVVLLRGRPAHKPAA